MVLSGIATQENESIEFKFNNLKTERVFFCNFDSLNTTCGGKFYDWPYFTTTNISRLLPSNRTLVTDVTSLGENNAEKHSINN